jgi:hypothetical protein
MHKFRFRDKNARIITHHFSRGKSGPLTINFRLFPGKLERAVSAQVRFPEENVWRASGPVVTW